MKKGRENTAQAIPLAGGECVEVPSLAPSTAIPAVPPAYVLHVVAGTGAVSAGGGAHNPGYGRVGGSDSGSLP